MGRSTAGGSLCSGQVCQNSPHKYSPLRRTRRVFDGQESWRGRRIRRGGFAFASVRDTGVGSTQNEASPASNPTGPGTTPDVQNPLARVPPCTRYRSYSQQSLTVQLDKHGLLW